MKTSFTNFWRRNLAAARLAIQSQLEYRANFLIDALLNPILSSAIEVALWAGLLAGMGRTALAGFGREYYLAYALWATFVGRVSTNWSYEFVMLDEIDSGRVNAVLMRPISFYEFYLSQFIGYKALVASTSLLIPLVVCLVMDVPLVAARLPLMLLLVAYNLVFTHTLSFCVACLAFFLNRAQSLTGIKNITIWVLAGELIPLDLYPEPLKTWLLRSPFAAATYTPVSFVTGRVGYDALGTGFLSVTIALMVMAPCATLLWRRGLRTYAGTGA